ncbi:hypothetical protein DUI87_09204 [Hirundo rustica rustica]|uniref:Uncharacterized protein n=1 Tax=Hirundo rustica rustica TaxID=333673 RepID=A0A3M0KM00_HIRRU|nr:hypothetical protein DUI87_09204 [Hirundo rustica rustica]
MWGIQEPPQVTPTAIMGPETTDHPIPGNKQAAGVSLSSLNTLCTSMSNTMPTPTQTIVGLRTVGKSDTY